MPAPARSDLDAIVFDFYGTLAEARGFTFAVAFETLLAGIGLDVDRAEFEQAYRREIRVYLTRFAAEGREQHNTVWVARALTAMGYPTTPDEERVRRAVDGYFTRYQSELRFYPRVKESLGHLSGRFRLGLLSNFTDPRPVRGALASEGLEPYFSSVVISAEIGWRKPHPAIFRRSLGELGIEPGRTLYVGDDPVADVRGAAGAGLRTAWVRGAQPSLMRAMSEADEPEAVTADHEIAQVADLVALLD